MKGAGTSEGNQFYRMLQEKKVVSSNVRYGDTQELLKKMTFLGDNANPNNIVSDLFLIK